MHKHKLIAVQCIDEKRIQINGALNKLSDNSGNYRSYRSLLQQKASTRVIPYLGALSADAVHVIGRTDCARRTSFDGLDLH